MAWRTPVDAMLKGVEAKDSWTKLTGVLQSRRFIGATQMATAILLSALFVLVMASLILVFFSKIIYSLCQQRYLAGLLGWPMATGDPTLLR